MSIRDKDMGWKALMSAVRQIAKSRPTITVGLHGEPHKGSDMTLAELGNIHEFGLGVPKRSFIRSTMDKNNAKYARGLAGAVATIASPTPGDYRRQLKRLALVIEGDVKKAISDGIPPPNAPSTIARKGSSKPLIATGQLRAGVRAIVADGKGGINASFEDSP